MCYSDEESSNDTFTQKVMVQQVTCNKGNWYSFSRTIVAQNYGDGFCNVNVQINTAFQNYVASGGSPMIQQYASPLKTRSRRSNDLLIQPIDTVKKPSPYTTDQLKLLELMNEEKDPIKEEVETDSTPIRNVRTRKIAWICFCSIFVVLFSAFLLHEQFINDNLTIQYDFIDRDIRSNILHQNDAVTTILDTLRHADRWSSKVFITPFVGPLGVGKTFMSSLIKRHFDPRLIFDLNKLNFANKEKQNEIIDHLRSDVLNLIVIEDLTMFNFKGVYEFISRISRDKHVLVIPIFGIQEMISPTQYRMNTGHVNEIRDLFELSDMHHSIVLFYPFKPSILNEWLNIEYKKRQVPVEKQEEITEFVKNSIDVRKTGLKGATAKLLLALGNF